MNGEIIIILDKSGSMSDCVAETIRGYNRFLDAQKEEGLDWKDVRLTTVLFDVTSIQLYQAMPLLETVPLTMADYLPDGGTALFDAVGNTLTAARQRMDSYQPERRPSRVIVLVITDGMENSSTVFSAAQVRQLILDQKKVGWEFFYLGANISDLSDAEKMGIDQNRQTTFPKNNMCASFNICSENAKDYLKYKPIAEDWGNKIKRKRRQL